MLRLFMVGIGFIGAVLGAEYGAKLFGVVGGIGGALGGGYLGLRIGFAPTALVLTLISVKLGRMSVKELHQSLMRGTNRLIPNLVLLELQRRGEDIEPYRPFVFDLLRSSEMSDRSRGLAALQSAFPELAERLTDYRISDSPEACRDAVERLSKTD